MRILQYAHWWILWGILIVGLIAIVKFAQGYMSGRAFTATDRRLLTGFSGLMDLQATLGLIFFLLSGFAGAGFPVNRILHGITMLAAVLVAHLSGHGESADHRTRFLNSFYILLGSFALMMIGVTLVSDR